MCRRTVGATLQALVAIRLREGGERVGQCIAEAKDINPHITPEVAEEVKEITAEVAEEVKEATSEVIEKLRAPKGAQLVSLRGLSLARALTKSAAGEG